MFGFVKKAVKSVAKTVKAPVKSYVSYAGSIAKGDLKGAAKHAIKAGTQMAFMPTNAALDTMGQKSVGENINGMLGLNAQKGAEPLTWTPSSSGQASLLSDVMAGQTWGKSIIGEGSLGRSDEEGLTGPEQAAARNQAYQRIQGATATNLRALKAAQGGQGIRGATAASQQMGVQAEGAQQKMGFEQDLLLQNRSIQEESKRFNLQQAAAEKYAQVGAGMGFAQIGAAQRGANINASAQVAAARQSGGGSKF
jgi:hypothetical protein